MLKLKYKSRLCWQISSSILQRWTIGDRVHHNNDYTSQIINRMFYLLFKGKDT